METPATHNHADPDVDCAICMDQGRRRGAIGLPEMAALLRDGWSLTADAERPRVRHSRSSGAAPSGRVSRSRAMPVGDRRSRPSESPHLLGVRAERGAILTIGVFAAAALRAAVPTGGRRSKPSPRLFAVCGTRRPPGGTERHRGGLRAPARCRSETGAPVVPALVQRLRCAAVTLAGWSVIGAGFALPRDAGRRPALLVFPCLQRQLGRSADLAAGLLGGTFAESRTPVGERTALPADRRRWKSPAAESRSRSSRWSRCSCRSSRG